MSTDLARIPDFQFGNWIPSLQIGNGIIQGQYMERVGHWTRVRHQVFINGFFRLNYTEAQVEDALRRNTTVQEIRIGTLPYEANSGASIFNLMVSNNYFVQSSQEILSIGARSIWGSPRMRVFANERTSQAPIGVDLSIEDLRPSTHGIFIEVRVSGTYTAFPDLLVTDPINTPPPTIIDDAPAIAIGSRVRISETAHTWATGQSISPWALGKIFTVGLLRNSNKELLLDGVNSWIRAEDVTLV
ncbi:MAG: hypothetical protein FWC68_04250 [Oscillospiraceae bacterium]|nr:hypothetical protein [Oscillospiraceae bacterium]